MLPNLSLLSLNDAPQKGVELNEIAQIAALLSDFKDIVVFHAANTAVGSDDDPSIPTEPDIGRFKRLIDKIDEIRARVFNRNTALLLVADVEEDLDEVRETREEFSNLVLSPQFALHSKFKALPRERQDLFLNATDKQYSYKRAMEVLDRVEASLELLLKRVKARSESLARQGFGRGSSSRDARRDNERADRYEGGGRDREGRDDLRPPPIDADPHDDPCYSSEDEGPAIGEDDESQQDVGQAGQPPTPRTPRPRFGNQWADPGAQDRYDELQDDQSWSSNDFSLMQQKAILEGEAFGRAYVQGVQRMRQNVARLNKDSRIALPTDPLAKVVFESLRDIINELRESLYQRRQFSDVHAVATRVQLPTQLFGPWNNVVARKMHVPRVLGNCSIRVANKVQKGQRAALFSLRFDVADDSLLFNLWTAWRADAKERGVFCARLFEKIPKESVYVGNKWSVLRLFLDYVFESIKARSYLLQRRRYQINNFDYDALLQSWSREKPASLPPSRNPSGN